MGPFRIFWIGVLNLIAVSLNHVSYNVSVVLTILTNIGLLSPAGCRLLVNLRIENDATHGEASRTDIPLANVGTMQFRQPQGENTTFDNQDSKA